MSISQILLKEFNSEVAATEKCLERITENTWTFKPHPRSMSMGYLSFLVAEIPLWIAMTLEKGEIDLATFIHAQPRTTADLTAHFRENVRMAREELQKASEEDMNKIFYLRTNGKEIFHSKNADNIGATINHWVHHRGQLTVYMRLNEIPVPAIYGPSADDNPYK